MSARGFDSWLGVHVVAPPHVGTRSDLRAYAGPADLLELRLDLLPGGADTVEAAAWVAAAPRPVLATVRSVAQGGAFAGAPADAARILQAAVRAGAAWVDAESDVLALLGPLPPGVRLVASVHGDGVLPVGAADRADCVKVARATSDLGALRAEAERAGRAGFGVPQGPLAATRVLFVGPGRPGLLYGGPAIAPGQPALPVLLDELRAGEVGASAAAYGLLGEPPARSPSPALHNAAFRAQDRDALYVPLPGLALEEALALPFRGYSVTHPFKQAAAAAAATGDADVRATGAANTLLRVEGGWHAANTDVAALRELIPAAGAGTSAYVHGAGGFARACVHVLREYGYAVRLGARDPQRGADAARALGVDFGGDAYRRATRDKVVVNATPAGSRGEEAAFLGREDLRGLFVLDAPYGERGARTAVVGRARADGAGRIVDGPELLVAQAMHQARLFAGERALPDELGRVLELALHVPPSLVLVGARGAGKSTVGRLVARELGRPFADIDDEVERATGRSPRAWIEAEGWEAFRVQEHAVLERVLAREGVVIATGGGVVDHAPSLAALDGRGYWHLHPRGPGSGARRTQDDGGARPRMPGAADPLDEARTLIRRRLWVWRALSALYVDAEQDPDVVARDVVGCWVSAARRQS